MVISLKHGSRPWLGNEPMQHTKWVDRKNPPAYMWKNVANVCLNCTRKSCDSYAGCDLYKAATKMKGAE